MVDVVKAMMSLERLKNYRAYLAGGERLAVNSSYGIVKTQEIEARIQWYKDEIESVDAFIEDRIREQVRKEQDEMARNWLYPKKRPWWKRIFDKKAKPLQMSAANYLVSQGVMTANEFRESVLTEESWSLQAENKRRADWGLPPYSGTASDVAQFERAFLGDWTVVNPEAQIVEDFIKVGEALGPQPDLDIVDETHVWTQDQAADYKDYVKPGSDHIEYGDSTNWPPYDR